MDKAQQDALKKAAGIEAAKIVKNGMMVGLGTGSTVRFLVDELGRRVQEGRLELYGSYHFSSHTRASRRLRH
jgi:hypothetical protein